MPCHCVSFNFHVPPIRIKSLRGNIILLCLIVSIIQTLSQPVTSVSFPRSVSRSVREVSFTVQFLRYQQFYRIVHLCCSQFVFSHQCVVSFWMSWHDYSKPYMVSCSPDAYPVHWGEHQLFVPGILCQTYIGSCGFAQWWHIIICSSPMLSYFFQLSVCLVLIACLLCIMQCYFFAGYSTDSSSPTLEMIYHEACWLQHDAFLPPDILSQCATSLLFSVFLYYLSY